MYRPSVSGFVFYLSSASYVPGMGYTPTNSGGVFPLDLTEQALLSRLAGRSWSRVGIEALVRNGKSASVPESHNRGGAGKSDNGAFAVTNPLETALCGAKP
jgi:hypothetical protein